MLHALAPAQRHGTPCPLSTQTRAICAPPADSLAFPAALDPVVWGTETSATAEAIPLRTAPGRVGHGGQAVFSWATSDPPVGTRYHLEWRFRGRPSRSISRRGRRSRISGR